MSNNIMEILDGLAEEVVFADGADMRVLGTMHTRFEEAAVWADSQAFSHSAALCRGAADTINRLVMDEVADRGAALTFLGEAVSALQQVAAMGREGEVSFPPHPVAEVGAAAPDESEAPAEAEADAAWAGDPSLVTDFIQEAMEHLAAADMHLLTLETNAGDTDALNAVFRAFHTIKGVAGFLSLGDILELAHESETLLDKARNGVLEFSGDRIDAAFDAVDAMKRLVESLAHSVSTGTAPVAGDDLAPLLVRIRNLASETGPAVPRQQNDDRGPACPSATKEDVVPGELIEAPHPRLGEILVESGAVSAHDVARALRTQKNEASAGTSIKEALRVDADRLDRLVDLIGELVIAETVVIQSPELQANLTNRMARHVSQLDKITRELQEIATSLRMVSLRSTFQKMARLARDVAKKGGKQIEFVTVGEDAELDKSVVDRIGDPLVHMIRNAVDHGLEASSEERVKAGKPAAGRVELRAYHKGSSVHIEIKDDGRGIDKDAVLAKAIERGVVSPTARLSDREIFALIFEAGFSTAKAVTDVSGRGVGMDVARKNIEAIRGQIEIQSESGKGTTFTIRLPLTLAIIDGMVVRVGGERYIIPTLSIIRAVRPEPNQRVTVGGRGEMLSLRGQLIPLLRMERLLGVTGAAADVSEAIAVVVEDEGRQIALLADELLGQQQIVIKSLGKQLQRVPGISGGAIMPDGNAGLIVDVGGLVASQAGQAVSPADSSRVEEGAVAV